VDNKLRRAAGDALSSSVMVFSGIVDPPTLEALACRDALALADDLMLGRVLIFSDCQQVVRDILLRPREEAMHASVIKGINIQAKNFSEIKFIYEGRMMNKETHNFARYALSLGPGKVFFSWPTIFTGWYRNLRLPRNLGKLGNLPTEFIQTNFEFNFFMLKQII
jgi:hypothetical protein